MLSALAGGGLTAVSLGGPLSGAALGAEAPAASPSPGEGAATPPVTASTPAASAPAAPSDASGQTTTSTPTAPPASTPPTSSGDVAGSGSASSPASAPAPAAAAEVPTVVLQRRQKVTPAKKVSRSVSATAPVSSSATPGTAGANVKGAAPSGPSNVALPPQLVAAQAKALAAELAGSAASEQALGFYRVPLFLLPIYQAAAVQYGVPWQILAAINEIETDYGSDQSVSTAGAVGWMQFMPSTWLQYGVDALNAGDADPYNPVDAIFAAARYLRAAGAESNLRGAILAYNHSEEYADSVLLRAKLIATYPKAVIATLTGLVDARPPVTGKRLAWGPLLSAVPASSATAHAAAPVAASGSSPETVTSAAPAPTASSAPAPAGSSPSGSPAAAGSAPATPGSTAPPTPALAAALATGKAGVEAEAPQFVDLMSAPNASVVAVQDGRIVQLGKSRKLGRYVVLRDVYGDVFTYAGLGSVAASYRLPKAPAASEKAAPAQGVQGHEPVPAQPASAGRQLPLTLAVKTPAKPTPSEAAAVNGAQEATATGAETTPVTGGKVRLFAHPGNPDALAAARIARRSSSRAGLHATGTDRRLPLRRGSVVAQGTVLGRVRVPLGAKDGHMRFAIRPAGDSGTIDPQAILENWMQLDTALHPQGAKGNPSLLGATASAVFLMSKSDLEREILSDPGIVMSACSRHEVAAGAIDKRMLAVLGFLSRSGLKPTVAALRCGGGAYAVSGYVSSAHLGDGLAISQINGVPITGHQGAGSITDTTIRTLLTLQGEFVPRQIVSLMRYPHAPSTFARPDHGDYIEIVFSPVPKRGATAKVTATKATSAAHAAGAGRVQPSPVVVSGDLSAAQWNTLIKRVAALPAPAVRVKPSSSAIPDSTSSTVPPAVKGSGPGKK
jgi:soluble lytic murein transglycosylase-like protein